jgi:ATP-dependent Clp protease ATP-binding subunit ClpX
LRELSLLLAMHSLGGAGHRAPNAIVIGPTGVGKTHSLSVASKLLGLPFVATDATSLVPSGIVGEQVEDVLDGLVSAADAMLAARRGRRRRDDDLELAGRGVILIDEFDKLATPDDLRGSVSADRRTIQRRLLKLAEGARLRVGVKHHETDYRDRFLDTSGILLIAGGAFSTLSASPWQAMSLAGGRHLGPGDIIGVGFIPELVGRLPLLIAFEPLAAADLVAIIDHVGVTPLASWQRYFGAALGVGLRLDEAAKWVVAERAAALGLGARGLQHILFPVLAEKAWQVLHEGRASDVVLHASDFLRETAAIPVATRVQ